MRLRRFKHGGTTEGLLPRLSNDDARPVNWRPQSFRTNCEICGWLQPALSKLSDNYPSSRIAKQFGVRHFSQIRKSRCEDSARLVFLNASDLVKRQSMGAPIGFPDGRGRIKARAVEPFQRIHARHPTLCWANRAHSE